MIFDHTKETLIEAVGVDKELPSRMAQFKLGMIFQDGTFSESVERATKEFTRLELAAMLTVAMLKVAEGK